MEQNPKVDPETRRKRLRFRAWHRGMREMDLILGRFADRHLDDFDATTLDRFEELLTRPDPELFGWLLGDVPVPPEHDTDLVRRLIAFSRAGIGDGEAT